MCNATNIKMIKRKLNQGQKGSKIKVKKLHNQFNSNAVEEPTSAIFNLIGDCCYEIFGWLTLKDLHSFGQTCEWAQQMAGTYFQSIYSRTQIECRTGCCNAFGIRNLNRCKVDGFRKFFPELFISMSSLLPFYITKANCSHSIKRITLQTHLMPTKIDCLKTVLKLSGLKIAQSPVRSMANSLSFVKI